MRDYVIVTDSSCDLPQEMTDAWGVPVVPLSVELGNQHFQNKPGEGPDSHEFFQRLYRGEPVRTSSPNVEEFKKTFLPILQAGKDILYLAFSSGLSATYHHGTLAARDLIHKLPGTNIITVDTLCASVGQGLLVEMVVEQKRQGKTIEEARNFAEQHKMNICHWFTVSNLTQLRRGGRLSASKAVFGSLLNIKPIIHVDEEGHLIASENAKGRKKSIELLVDHMEQTALDPTHHRAYISQADCMQEAQQLAAMVKERLQVPNVAITNIGPVIGAHTGIGTLTLVFYGTAR